MFFAAQSLGDVVLDAKSEYDFFGKCRRTNQKGAKQGDRRQHCRRRAIQPEPAPDRLTHGGFKPCEKRYGKGHAPGNYGHGTDNGGFGINIIEHSFA